MSTLGAALAVSGLSVLTAGVVQAASTGMIINEVYGGGGSTSASASYKTDFVELLNPTGSAQSLNGLSLQYRSGTYNGTGTVSVLALPDVSVPAGSTYLVQVSNPNGCGGNPCGGADLPAPDHSGTALSMAGGSGQVILAEGATGITATGTSMHTVTDVVDFVGYGTAGSSETAPTGTATTNTTSVQRTNTTDGDNNATDFAAPAVPSPEGTGTVEQPLSATDPGDKAFLKDTAIRPVTLAAANGTEPYSWTTTALPAGLTLTGNEISGTPTTAGATTVTATVEDAATPAETASTEFTITVVDPAVISPIANIQGNGAASPIANTPVVTQGVVTALYPTGGFNGFYIQTPGPDTADRSDAIFVFVGNNGALMNDLAIGESVKVFGTVKEFSGLTEIDVAAGTVEEIPDLGDVSAKTVIPGTDCALPGTGCLDQTALDAAREAAEGELFAPTGSFTVTDVYDGSAYNPPNSGSGSNFGEIGIAANSDEPLITPTDIVDAQDTAAIADRTRWNNAHRVILDDGSSTTYWNTTNNAGGQDAPLPWFTQDHQVRVGAGVIFDEPVVLDHRFGWKLQPTSPIVGPPTGRVSFEQDRPASPAAVGGDLELATFNVLNYFTTFGEDVPGCASFKDRDDNPVAVDDCPGNGPRGAWNQVSFDRQQAKIVKAINTIDADIVSVEEIENSLVVDGHDRDEALAALVTALNAAAGAGTWDYVRSPASASAPANIAGQDVIRTGFIYKPAHVQVVGEAEMLFGVAAFGNAREPFAAVFKPTGGVDGDRFAVIVNHFKSKGSGIDDGTGQGKANPDRVAQATELSTFASAFASARGIRAIFLTGDFNSYSQEDPMQVLYGAGYTQLKTEGKHTYSFDGQSGSLDHVLANPAAATMVTGVDIWEINANETVFNQYSRYNYVGTDLYNDGPFSASDHNPEVIGIKRTKTDTPPSPQPVQLAAKIKPKKVVVDKTRVKVKVTVVDAAGKPVTGQVSVKVKGQKATTVTVVNGKLKVRLKKFSSIGKKKITITYLGTATQLPAKIVKKVRVVRR
ncbi:ExeM/NucH family extracellular endonuclease [Nocardioides carbamazepini]|uniref:ExeM/NucH family extracellular endonuclease n=1 Tax=Nocardioides carbamazepini TaxID=2854259 RepID=UPI00214A1B5C|nr:ExeM/NucH family extracellular endonuclease [Nocardioides carbamazepini]MCR1783178.1 ExeM/NucH family extracellular endonuclease [Nocardioides carbamazepini]